MDSFEQIKLEKEIKELIKGYRKEYTQDDLKRLDEIEKAFGAKNPAEIDMWKTVWDDFNIDYNTGIPESYLPEAIKGALGLTDKKANDAVNIGQEFDLLVEGTPSEKTISLEHADPDDSIYRLVLPEERPDLYFEEVEEYADRNKWKQIWERFGLGDSEHVTKPILINAIKSVFGVESEAAGRAIIEVGMMANCIIEQESGGGINYELSSERPEEYWLEIWDQSEGELGTALPANRIKPPIAVEEGVTVAEAEEILEDAVDRGEIYSPEDEPDDHYTINDPATDEGPEIKQKLGGGSDDDPDSDIDQSTNGAAPETEAQSEGEGGSTGSDESDNTTENVSESHSESTNDQTSATADQQPTGTGSESAGATDGVPSDDELEPPGDIEGGVDSSIVFDDAPGIDDEDISVGGDEPDDDGTTRFQTYEEPDLDTPGIDVDTNAVAQFIEHHATTKESDGESLKTPTDTMINAFTEWAEINDIDLDQLDPDIHKNKRKGNLTPILEDAFGIEKKQRRIDNSPTRVYVPVRLSEEIQNLI